MTQRPMLLRCGCVEVRVPEFAVHCWVADEVDCPSEAYRLRYHVNHDASPHTRHNSNRLQSKIVLSHRLQSLSLSACMVISENGQPHGKGQS